MKTEIKRAQAADAARLTSIAFAAKRYWMYPEEWMQIWKNELTVTEEYIESNLVFIARHGEKIIGFYSIVYNPEDIYIKSVFVDKGYWLEHIFIDPPYIGKGIGRQLIHHACAECRFRNIPGLYVFADPNALGFYKKINARFLRTSASSIQGRSIPVFFIDQ